MSSAKWSALYPCTYEQHERDSLDFSYRKIITKEKINLGGVWQEGHSGHDINMMLLYDVLKPGLNSLKKKKSVQWVLEKQSLGWIFCDFK